MYDFFSHDTIFLREKTAEGQILTIIELRHITYAILYCRFLVSKKGGLVKKILRIRGKVVFLRVIKQ